MVSTMTSVEKMKIPEGYKQTEVGVIPDDWEASSLPDFVWYQEGPGLRNWQFTSKGIKVINVTNLQYTGFLDLDKTSRHISIDEFEKMYRHFECDAGDFVMASSGNSYSKSSIVRECDLPLVMNTSVIRFKAKEKIDSLYMQSYLRSDFFKDQIDLMITGGAQPNFGPYHLDRILLPTPPSLKEQIAIGNALSDVDNLIASLETLITKKSAIKTAAMQQLLTGKKRLPAFVKESEKQGAKQSSEPDNTSETAQAALAKQTSTLNSDLYKESGEGLDSKLNQLSEVSNANNKQTAPRPGYKQSELGEIPEDWEVYPLGESLSIMHGKDQKQVECSDGKYPILGTGGEMGRTDSYLYNKPSVLIGRKGSINKPRYMDSPFWTVDTLFYSQVSEKFNAKFIYYKFCMIDWMTYNEASGVPSLNSSTIESVVQVFPETRVEQTAIANVLSDMDIELDALQQRLSKTQKIKQGMMQELLTGKTRLV